MRPNRFLTLVLVLLFCGYSIKAAIGDVKFDTVPDYKGWGWDALVLDNDLVQLVIIPEIGGRIMFYGFSDDQYIAVNSSQVGHDYDPGSNTTGPWTSWGYGGYKCWPAPQSRWNWPPPPRLDWGVYTYTTEHASADSVVIYMQSEVETSFAAGLQQARRITFYKNSSKVAIEQILKNVSNANNSWSIWEVTQSLPSHNGGSDYSNISIYFPGKSADIEKLRNNGVNLSTVNDSILKYNHNSQDGKIGILDTKGWSCYVDERDLQAYVKVFNCDPVLEYPDNNTNFQLYAGGGYDEIEVLGPMETIDQGDSASYTEYWYATVSKGPILNVNRVGLVSQALDYFPDVSRVTGNFGVFQTGKFGLRFLDESGNQLDAAIHLEVNPLDTIEFDVTGLSIPIGTKIIKASFFDLDNHWVDDLDSYVIMPVGKKDIEVFSFKLFPTIIASGDQIDIELSKTYSENLLVTLTSLNGQIIDQKYINNNSRLNVEYTTPQIAPGIYFITIKSGDFISNSKLIVK